MTDNADDDNENAAILEEIAGSLNAPDSGNSFLYNTDIRSYPMWLVHAIPTPNRDNQSPFQPHQIDQPNIILDIPGE